MLVRKAHVYHSGVMSVQTSLMDGKPRKSVHARQLCCRCNSDDRVCFSRNGFEIVQNVEEPFAASSRHWLGELIDRIRE